MRTPGDLRSIVEATLAASRDDVVRLARRIYDDPELSGQEHFASAACAELLEQRGFEVEWVPGVETAFVATLTGSGDGPTVGLLAEYDALPGLGHACGHHLIAGSAVGAGIALAGLASQLPGTVKVFGCPAEEIGLGKIAMLDAGAFEGTDLALTFHGHDVTSVMTSSTGVQDFVFTFKGRPAHAAADPWMGASALDGVLLTMNNVNALRQFVRDGVRIHGYVPNGGGAHNVIVEEASCHLAVRSADIDELERVVERVHECARAGALASGTELSVEPRMSLQPVIADPRLADLVRRNLRACGETEVEDWVAMPSTDFGNVSQAVPSVLFSVATWPLGTGFHTHATTDAGGREQAMAGMLTSAAAMALTTVDVMTSDAK